MAQHDLALKVSTELPVGSVDLDLPVKRNGRRIGTFTINAKGVSWNPATAKAPSSLSWEDLPAALAGAQATSGAAPAAAAKKTSNRKVATTKHTARNATKNQDGAAASASESAPVAESVPVAAPVPETAAPVSESESAPAAKTAAKKSTARKAAAKSTAVNARAVRDWAADNGINVGPRGPIAAHIIEQYRAATA